MNLKSGGRTGVGGDPFLYIIPIVHVEMAFIVERFVGPVYIHSLQHCGTLSLSFVMLTGTYGL